MSKKNFKKGFNGLLGEDIKEKEFVANIKDKVIHKSDHKDEKRATFIVSNKQLDAIKAISFWERRMLKDVLNEALSSYIINYENKNGEIKYPQ